MLASRQWMKDHYYLQRNPFPRDAILKEDSGEPSENGSIFNPGVNKTEVTEFYEKFVLQPVLHGGSGFGALWSLGANEAARGYGKSSLGQFGCKSINADWGKKILTDLGMEEAETKQHRVMASFAAFDRNNVTSFNSVAFEHVTWLSETREPFYDRSPLERLRGRILTRLKNDGTELDAGTEEETETIVSEVEDARLQMKGKKLGPLVDDFVTLLAEGNIREIRRHLEDISTWNRLRNGFSYLDTAITFAKAARISKVVLFVDQVEDFANTNVSKSKRVKEVERFRDIIEETAPFSRTAYYVLTMHPLAQQVIADTWDEARLPSLALPPPEGTEAENIEKVQVLRGIKDDAEAFELFKAYLNDAEYRVEGAPSELHPFDEEAITAIREHHSGRPGHMLKTANAILDLASKRQQETIDADFVAAVLDGEVVGGETTVEPPPEKGLSKSLQ